MRLLRLALLGLTDKEAADFITFWAPQIRANEYTFVSFDASSYTARARYSFTDEAGAPVEPDTFIRVFMTVRAADANEEVTPRRASRSSRCPALHGRICRPRPRIGMPDNSARKP